MNSPFGEINLSTTLKSKIVPIILFFGMLLIYKIYKGYINYEINQKNKT